MIDLGPHAVFIVWAYAGVALAIGGLIGWSVLAAGRLKRREERLEASGIRRRSAR